MNMSFWEQMASKWKLKDKLLDFDEAYRKGKEYGSLLNSQDSGYSDIDFFSSVEDEDEEDGI